MAAIASTQSGDFNTGATWVGGVAPTEGDTCTIENGHTVTIDGDITVGDDSATSAIDILSGGILDWDNADDDDLTLKGDLYLSNGGTLSLNGAGDGTKTLTVKLNYSAALANGKYGLIIEDGGIVNCDGFNKTRSWDTLSADGASGQKVVVTANDNSAIWGVGDEFIVGSMSQVFKAGAETDTIDSFATTSITKAGANYSYTHEENVAFINLTRNVVFTSYNTSYKGYVFITNNTDTNVAFDWVEFSYLGSNAANKYGVVITSQDYGIFNYCSFHHSYRAVQGNSNNAYLTVDNCVFGKNTFYDFVGVDVTGSVSNCAALGCDNDSMLTIYCGVTDSHIGNCDSDGYRQYSVASIMTSCRVYGCGIAVVEWQVPLGLDGCYLDGNNIGILSTFSIVRLPDCSFGAQVANTTDINAACVVIGTGFNTTALTVTVTGSVDNRVSIESTANAHKTWMVNGTFEKQSTTKYSGSNAVLMNPTDADDELIASSAVFAVANETVAYSCYSRKSVAMTVLPYVKLSGKGITTSTATMANTQDDWQLMTVSGVATSDGFCKLELICQNASGNVYVDDDQDSYTFWFEGNVPCVVPKPSLTANDLLNTAITTVSWSSGTFGDLVKKGNQMWQVILTKVLGR